MTFLLMAGWLICCVYSTIPSFWLVIHPRARWWSERKRLGRPVYKFLVPMWMAMWFAAALITAPWRYARFYSAHWTWLPAVLLISVGFSLYSKARHGFSPLQLSGHHELEPERHQQRLVVQGIRQRVRHPIYLGHLCEMLGWSVGTGLIVGWALTGFAVLTGAIMIRLEECELVERFGESYREYQKRVPLIVPKFRDS
jgi:protein-S-isoprenylcysteine O-methyltransferase Ste14